MAAAGPASKVAVETLLLMDLKAAHEDLRVARSQCVEWQMKYHTAIADLRLSEHTSRTLLNAQLPAITEAIETAMQHAVAHEERVARWFIHGEAARYCVKRAVPPEIAAKIERAEGEFLVSAFKDAILKHAAAGVSVLRRARDCAGRARDAACRGARRGTAFADAMSPNDDVRGCCGVLDAACQTALPLQSVLQTKPEAVVPAIGCEDIPPLMPAVHRLGTDELDGLCSPAPREPRDTEAAGPEDFSGHDETSVQHVEIPIDPIEAQLRDALAARDTHKVASAAAQPRAAVVTAAGIDERLRDSIALTSDDEKMFLKRQIQLLQAEIQSLMSAHANRAAVETLVANSRTNVAAPRGLLRRGVGESGIVVPTPRRTTHATTEALAHALTPAASATQPIGEGASRDSESRAGDNESDDMTRVSVVSESMTTVSHGIPRPAQRNASKRRSPSAPSRLEDAEQRLVSSLARDIVTIDVSRRSLSPQSRALLSGPQ